MSFVQRVCSNSNQKTWNSIVSGFMLVEYMGSSAHYSSVIVIHVLIGGAELLYIAPDRHTVGREPSTKLFTRSVGSMYMSTDMTV